MHFILILQKLHKCTTSTLFDWVELIKKLYNETIWFLLEYNEDGYIVKMTHSLREEVALYWTSTHAGKINEWDKGCESGTHLIYHRPYLEIEGGDDPIGHGVRGPKIVDYTSKMWPMLQ